MKQAEKIIIRGNIPFALLIEDSLNENLEIIPQKSIVTVSNDGEIFANVNLRRIVKTQENGFKIAIEDFFGDFTYTKFCISLTREATKKKSLEDSLKIDQEGKFCKDHLTDLAYELIYKLVRAYKFTLNQKKDWIPDLTKIRLCPFKINIFNSEEKQIDGIETLDYRGTGHPIGNLVSKEEFEKIKYLCHCSSFNVDTAAEFLSEANRFKQIGNYKSAVIYISFYFEKFIFREIKYKLEKDGFTENEIYNKIRKKNGRYIHRYKAIELITENQDFKKSKEFINYEKYIVIPRNEIAHNDNYNIVSSMAENMIKAGNEFINYLINAIWQNNR